MRLRWSVPLPGPVSLGGGGRRRGDGPGWLIFGLAVLVGAADSLGPDWLGWVIIAVAVAVMAGRSLIR